MERTIDSRMKGYIDAGREPPLPKIEAGQYLVDAMLTLGPIRSMPMGGVRATDWPEIWPFMQATKAVTETWEVEALHAMCGAFAKGLETGKNPFAKSPMERQSG